MTELQICPTCGNPVVFTTEPDYDGPTCNPIRFPQCWKVTGRSTKPDQWGSKRLLRLVEGDRGERP